MFKRIFKIVAGVAMVLLILVGAVLAYATTMPDTFRLERSILVEAPPEAIYPFVNDFHRWKDWSPFENIDPELKRTYGGSEAGVGATYAWDGPKAGAGRMEIKESTPAKLVSIQLDFTNPYEARNVAEFTFEPTDEGTKVTWAMSGPNAYMGKVMQVFINFDSMVGKNFETGLTTLKTVAEKESGKSSVANAAPVEELDGN